MIQIGHHQLQGHVYLAPMAGITDSIFRQLCVQNGAGYAVSEMIAADTSLYASDKTLNRLKRIDDIVLSPIRKTAIPHAVQLVGYDPVMLATAARLNVDAGAQIIDINMGCPAKKVCNRLAGSALLSDERKVEQILQAVVKAVDVPVTLKIRTGPDRDNRNGCTIARIAEQSGIAMLAVHGRTRADRFKGEAEYHTIAAIKDRVHIPVLANGDITTPKEAKRVLTETGADGLMIGRAAQGYPWLFREINYFLAHGKQLPAAGIEERHQVLKQHVRGLHKLYGEFRGVRIARKHIAWYSRLHRTTDNTDSELESELVRYQRGSARFRQAVNYIENPQEQLDMISRFFTQPGWFESHAAA